MELKWIVDVRDFVFCVEPHLEIGLVEIQTETFAKRTEGEKEASRSLCINNPGNNANPTLDAVMSADSYAIAARSERRPIQYIGQESYSNCVCIIGSVTEGERIWSLASYVLQEQWTLQLYCSQDEFWTLEFWDVTVDTVDKAFRDFGI